MLCFAAGTQQKANHAPNVCACNHIKSTRKSHQLNQQKSNQINSTNKNQIKSTNKK